MPGYVYWSWCYYLASVFASLFVTSADHGVVNGSVVPAGLVTELSVDDWNHHLLQLIRQTTCTG